MSALAFVAARDAYLAAKAACDAHDAAFIDPVIVADEAGPERSAQIASIPKVIWDEGERLDAIRFAAEDDLMAIPSPDVGAFALKVFVCCGEGRALHGYDDLLAEEAATFAFGQPAEEVRP